MEQYELRVRTTFDAAHYLRHYEGKCSRLHGHTWTVEVAVAGTDLDGRGMLVDFLDLKGVLRDITGRFDHTLLNEVPPFGAEAGKGMNPTAENLARFVFQELRQKLRERIPGVHPVSVQVWESDSSSVVYRQTTTPPQAASTEERKDEDRKRVYPCRRSDLTEVDTRP